MKNTPLILAMMVAIPAALSGANAELSISHDSSGSVYELSIQGAPAGSRLQLVDGVNPLGVALIDRNGNGHFTINSLPAGPHTIRAVEWGTGTAFGESPRFNAATRATNSFAVAGTYATGVQPAVVQAGDLDGNGFPGLILGSPGKVVLMHNESGSLGLSATLANIGETTGFAVGDFNGDGRNDLAISAAEGRVAVFLNKGAGEFILAGYFATGAHPSAVVTADFNGDGIPDLATANRDGNSISVLLGHGDGTFQPAFTVPVGNAPRALLMADFNNDGVPDLATANFGSNDVSILLGDGKGTFRTAREFAAGKGPVLLALADFNEDGAPDLAILNQIDHSVSLLLSDGSTAFRAGVSIPGVSSLAAADINGDGYADLVLLTGEQIVVRPGLGNGTFGEGAGTPVAPSASQVLLDDFNRDGHLDLATVDLSGVLTVLWGADVAVAKAAPVAEIQASARRSNTSIAQAMPGGSLPSVILSAVPASAVLGKPVTLKATITPIAATGKVTFYDGTAILGSASVSAGTATLVTISIPNGARHLTARYTGDSTYARAASSPITENITSNAGGAFVPASNITLTDFRVQGMALADLNHDGYPDMVTSNSTSGYAGSPTISVFLNNHDGTFKSPSTYLYATVAGQLAIADIDLDGNPDIVLATSNGVVWLKGNPDGTFQGASTILSSTDIRIVRIADLNSDGYPDVVVTHTATPTIEVRLGNGDGTFQTMVPVTSSVPIPPFFGAIADLAIGDFNRDGSVDLAVTTNSFNSVMVLAGAGDGTFLPPVAYPTDANNLAVADVNNDGYLDIVTGSTTPNVLLGNGDGTFQSPRYVPVDPPPGTNFHELSVVDVDGDGNADIVGGTSVSNLVVFFGKGDGTCRAPINTYLFANTFLSFADLNGDGVIDLVASGTGGQPISIYSGRLAPHLTLSASPATVPVGQDVVLTLHSSFADAAGTIVFTDASTGTALGSAPLSNGIATFHISRPARGNRVYQANYLGDSKYAPTAAPLLGVEVQQAIGIVLSASPNPGLPGQIVTLTATLSTNPGNAAVIFLDGTTPLNFQTVYSTTATFQTTLNAGVHQLRVVFPEYQGFESTSAGYTETIAALGGGQLIPGQTYPAGANPTGILAADFTGDGLTDIVVENSTSRTLSFFPGTGLGKLQTGLDTALSFAPGAMTAVLFPGNSTPSLEITDPANNLVHTVLYGSVNGSASFNDAGTRTVGTQPVAIGAADFDGDGTPDLITANAGSNNVSVLLSAQAALTLPALTLPTGTHPDALVTSDFNHDGNADFAVANRDDNTLSVFLGNGDATFRTPLTIAAGSGPVAMAAGDLNGDGIPDLAILDGGSSQILILLGSGSGNFSTLPAISAAGASAIALGQLTASGHLDLVVTASAGLLIYTGNGDGTFQAPTKYAQYAAGSAVLAAPFILDGRMSLVIATPGANSVSLLLNEVAAAAALSVTPAQGRTGGRVTFTVNVTPSTAIGWFTIYDGTLLVGSGVVSNGQGSFSTTLLLPGPHSFSARFDGLGYGRSSTAAIPYTVTSVASVGLAPAPTQQLVNLPANLVAGDFNHDGFEDFAFQVGGSALEVVFGNGDGTFSERSPFVEGGAPAIAADFNRDGFTDLAFSQNFAVVDIGNGLGTFSQASPGNSPLVAASALAAADVDGDSIPDLVLANPDGTVDVLPGIGDGTFQTARVYPAGANPTALAIADLNEDGIPDIVVANRLSTANGALNVLLGAGSGGFSNAETLLVDAAPISMAVADFNGDHHTDVALLHTGSNTITLLAGKGDGTFGPPNRIALPSIPVRILSADMNSDGIPDLLVLFTTGSPAFAVLDGNGDGTFQTPTLFQDARTPIDFAVGDINNDGRLDIVVASNVPNSLFPQQGIDVFLGAGTALSVLQGSGQSTAAGTTFPIALKVHTTPLTTVTFSAPSAGPGGSFAGAVTVNVVANVQGVAAAPPFTANGQVGSYSVVVSARNLVGATFSLTNIAGPPAFIGAVFPPQQLETGINTPFPRPLQAVVLDAGKNPLPNATVTFTLPASGASATFPGGFTTATGLTNSSGTATSPILTANGTGGTYAVLASVPGVAEPAILQATNWAAGQFVLTDVVSYYGNASMGTGGVTYAVDGISYTGTQIFNWHQGDTHTLSIPPQTMGIDGYAFTGWSDGGAPTHVFTVPAGAGIIAANFKVLYALLVDQPAGGSISPPTSYFDPGSLVTVIATPDAGYAFTGFEGQGIGLSNGATNSLSFNLTSPVSISADFTPLSQLVTAHVSHTGHFTENQKGATYSVAVTAGASVTFRTGFSVTATEIVPPGLTLMSMAGAGWNCAANTCRRSDLPSADGSYPPITVTMNVALNAPSLVVNKVTITADNQGPVAASDPTIIDFPAGAGSIAQTIAFGAVATHIMGNPPFTLNASASSGLAVAFTSSSGSVCTVSGATVTLVGAGTCSITAAQPGSSLYAPAAPVAVTFTVDPAFADSTDQPANELAAINLMASYGITTGCSMTPFDYCPNEAVTRGQMAVFIVRGIFGSNNFVYNPTPYFTDVPADAQFFKYIQKMKDLGITNGETATTYGPDHTVTRGQMAVFIIRARYGAAATFTSSTTPYFTDVPADAPFFNYIQKMRDIGITNGETATTYGPDDTVTRAQMAVFLMRGAYNMLLPAGTPVITSVSPATGTAGKTVNVTITGLNTNFVQGSSVVKAGTGITVQSVTVNSSASLVARLAIAAEAPPGPQSILVTTGGVEAVAPNGFTIISDPAAGVLAYWTGNGTTLNATSGVSANLSNGATYAPATSRTTGRLDQQAFSLNGTNSYVQPGAGETSTLSGARTLVAWVYPNASTGAGMPILAGGQALAGDMFGISGTTGTCNGAGQYRLYIDHWGASCYVSGLSLLPNAWSFVAVTFDGTNVVFYVNGVASVPIPAQMYDYGLSTYEIGGNTLGGTSTAASFNGLLSEVQIYGRALSPVEIQGIYAP